MTTAEGRASNGVGKDLVIYVCLLALAGVQFFIAYRDIDAAHMLVQMFAVACIEAALAVLFFMHLWGEKRIFTVLVLVLTISVLLGLQYGWTDSSRMLNGAPFSSVK